MNFSSFEHELDRVSEGVHRIYSEMQGSSLKKEIADEGKSGTREVYEKVKEISREMKYILEKCEYIKDHPSTEEEHH